MPDHDHNHHDHSHGHDHSHHSHGIGHSHSHLDSKNTRSAAFRIGLFLTLGFVLVEVVAGIFSNSLALISDAGHNLTDALALAFSWWALHLTRRAPTNYKTYGYHRAGILAAALNSASLLAVAAFIFFESAQRLFDPPAVEGWTVVWVAGVALAVNLLVAWMLFDWSGEDLNTRSAFLHILTDAGASVGVIVAGIIEIVTGWKLADPVISILLGVIIFWSGWIVLKQVVNVLLEGIPEGLDVPVLISRLQEQPHVTDVHDLHVWTIGTGFRALSCHITIDDTCSLQNANETVQAINHLLEEEYDIRHATVQVECLPCMQDGAFCVVPSQERAKV